VQLGREQFRRPLCQLKTSSDVQHLTLLPNTSPTRFQKLRMEPHSFQLVSSARYFYHGLAIHPNLLSGCASVSFGAIRHSGGLTARSTWHDLIKNLGYCCGQFSLTSMSLAQVSALHYYFLHFSDCPHLVFRLIYLLYPLLNFSRPPLPLCIHYYLCMYLV